MTDKHESRRVRITKRLMKEALLELLEENELVNISVTAICKTADVHRSTFYDFKKCLCIQTGLPPSHAGLNIFRLFRLWQYKIRHIPDHAV